MLGNAVEFLGVSAKTRVPLQSARDVFQREVGRNGAEIVDVFTSLRKDEVAQGTPLVIEPEHKTNALRVVM